MGRGRPPIRAPAIPHLALLRCAALPKEPVGCCGPVGERSVGVAPVSPAEAPAAPDAVAGDLRSWARHGLPLHADDACELVHHEAVRVQVRAVRVPLTSVLVGARQVRVREPKVPPLVAAPHVPVPAARVEIGLLFGHGPSDASLIAVFVRLRDGEERVGLGGGGPVVSRGAVVGPPRVPHCVGRRVGHQVPHAGPAPAAVERTRPEAAALVRMLPGQRPSGVHARGAQEEQPFPHREELGLTRPRTRVQVLDPRRAGRAPVRAPKLPPPERVMGAEVEVAAHHLEELRGGRARAGDQIGHQSLPPRHAVAEVPGPSARVALGGRRKGVARGAPRRPARPGP
mmetsp:Transcript_46728/g.105633  ORF Transcript_46728/g.105633 Transcript_46728/m.105633 type:complete len:342 (-) Transcript_46728:1911-2936(-)